MYDSKETRRTPPVRPMNKKIAQFLWMTAGTWLMAVGIYFFKIPNGFATGGVSGIGTVLGRLTPVSPSTWITVINVTLLLLGFLILGRSTGIKTVYCSLLLSGALVVFEKAVPLEAPVSDQPLLELIYAMLLTAIGSAIIFHAGASSGGTDIVALILKKYTRIDVGRALLCSDFLIAFSSFFVFGVTTGLFSLLGLFAKAFLVDAVIDEINSCKYFVVITDKHDEIAQFIMQSLGHGVTSHRAMGDYTQSEKYMIHTVCRRVEAIRLQRRIREIDPAAFIIITTSSEIIGKGFRSV